MKTLQYKPTLSRFFCLAFLILSSCSGSSAPSIPDSAPTSIPAVVGEEPITQTTAANVAVAKILEGTAPALAAALSADGAFIALGHQNGSITVWDIKTATKTHELTGHTEAIIGVAISHDGKLLASSGYDKTIRLWDIRSKQETAVLKDHTEVVSSLAFSPDGAQLVSAADDRKIYVWNLETNKVQATLETKSKPQSVIFNPDGKVVAYSDDKQTIYLWDTSTTTESSQMEGTNDAFASYVTFDANGTTLASVGNNGIQIWDIKTNKEIARTQNVTTLVVNSASFSPDSSLLASGNGDGTVRLWNTQDGKELAVLKGHKGSVTSVWFTPDSKLLVLAGKDNTVHVWGVSNPPPSTTDKPIGATLKGRIEAMGKPSANERFTVRITPDTSGQQTQNTPEANVTEEGSGSSETAGESDNFVELETKTDADGQFVLTDLISGTVKINNVGVSVVGSYSRCEFEGFSGLSLTGTNASGQKVIIMILSSTGEIKLNAGEVTTRDLIVTCS